MTLTEIVTEIMYDTKADVIKSYKDKGLRASGKFEDSLRVEVKESGTITGQLWGVDYTWYLERGRDANKEKTRGQVGFLGKILEQWVKDKGISVNPYAAAYKIVHEGINVPNKHNPGKLLADVINDEYRQKIKDRIGSMYRIQIVSEVLNMIK